MKKLLWVFYVLLVLALCLFIARLALFPDPISGGILPGLGPSLTPTAPTEPPAEMTSAPVDPTAAPTAAPSAAPTPIPTATPAPMTEEEYDALIQQEIEELQNEEPLRDENDQEIPVLDVSQGEVIEIGDTEIVGSV